MDNATYILWSKDMTYRNCMMKNRNKSIFISHGRTSRIYDCRSYMLSVSSSAKYVVCVSDEEACVVRNYSDNNIIPLVTGLPRHDLIAAILRDRFAWIGTEVENPIPSLDKESTMDNNYLVRTLQYQIITPNNITKTENGKSFYSNKRW